MAQDGAVAAGLGGGSGADLTELSLEELGTVKVPTVVGASKREQKATEAPSAVSVVTAEEIKFQGYRDLADILRSVRGLYVSYDRGYGYLGVRGVNRLGDYGGRTLVTINGHRINEPVFDSAFIGSEFPLDVDLIERVEVIRGPGSVLYGNNAFFTIVNVVTRSGGSLAGLEASGAVGSYDAASGRLTYGNRWKNGWEVMVSGTLSDRGGHDQLYYPEFADVNDGYADRLDHQKVKQLYSAITYKDLTLEGVYGSRSKELPTAPYGTLFNEPGNAVQDDRGMIELRYTHEFAGEWSVKARLFVDHYRYQGWYPFAADDPSADNAVVQNEDRTVADFWGGEAQVSKVFLEQHRITLGTEFRDDLNLRQESYDVDPPHTYADVTTDSDTVGVYLQDEWSILRNLTLNAGVRWDNYRISGDTVNPRAGLIYSPVQPTTLKFLYGQAYRAPNAFELDYVSPGYESNHELSPEEVDSYELVWEQAMGGHLRFTAAGFWNEMHQLITQQEDPDTGDLVFQNTDEVTAKGVEFELQGRWPRALQGRVSYTFADVREGPDDRRSNNSPAHLFKFGVSVPLYLEKVYASLELQATSRRVTRDRHENAGFWLANVTLFSRELVKNLELSASLYNLFDQTYYDPMNADFTQEMLEQDGRSFRVKLTYRF